MDASDLADISPTVEPLHGPQVPAQGMMLINAPCQVFSTKTLDDQKKTMRLGVWSETADLDDAIVYRETPLKTVYRPHRQGSAQFKEPNLPTTLGPEALTLFMKIETKEDALAFASRYGLLGLDGPGYRFVPKDHDLAELVNAYFGEPVAPWLYHASRLRTWKQLIKNSAARDGASAKLIAKRKTYLLSVLNPTALRMADESQPPYVYPIIDDVEYLECDEQFFNFEDERTIEQEVERFVKSAASAQLRGMISLAADPVATRDHLIANSTIGWLYLEFFRKYVQNIDRGQGRMVTCIVCDEAIREHPKGRGRKRFCTEAHQRLCMRYGLEEARQRVKSREMPAIETLESLVTQLVRELRSKYGLTEAIRRAELALGMKSRL